MSVPNEYQAISIALANWFRENREPYFFRKDRNPYRVWISEVALQQTRMQAALPVLKRFLEKFPDIDALAKSTEEEVVQAWAGLGYYNRARNIRKGSMYIKTFHGGKFPQKNEAIRKIPSIGEYTSAIISSICFGEKYPAIDGNVKRIASRIWQIGEYYDSKEFLDKVHTAVVELLNYFPGSAGDFNESLMEFGQKICRKVPQCEICVIEKYCGAFKQKTQEKFPFREKMKEKEDLYWEIFIPVHKKKYVIQKFENFPFLKGHWGFLSRITYANSISSQSWGLSNLQNILFSNMASYDFKHTIMHYKIRVIVKLLPDNFINIDPEVEFLWVNENELSGKMASSLMKKVCTFISSEK